MGKFTVYQDSSQWFLKRWWYWAPPGDGEGHGPFPFRWMAVLAAHLST